MAPKKPVPPAAAIPVPLNAASPEVLLQIIMRMAQEGLLPASASQPSPVPPASSPIPDPEATTSDDPPPPIQGRLFDRAGRGTGGELAEKQRISREITASATKRKALVDSDVEVQPSPKPADVGGKKVKQAKRLKSQANGNRRSQKPLSKLPQEPAYPTPTPEPQANPTWLPNPISTPTPATPVRPVARLAKAKVKAEPLQHLNVPPVDAGGSTSGAQNDEGDDGSNSSDVEAEAVTPTNNGQNPMLAGPLNSIFQALLAKMGETSVPVQQTPVAALQAQPPAVPTSQDKRSRTSLKDYPENWQKLLNIVKVAIRSSILLKNPFPSSKLSCIVVTECFHETFETEVNDGLVLEPGFTWSNPMERLLRGEISTCRSELKKLAKILVGSDPELFPSLKSQAEAFEGKTTPEIRLISAQSKNANKRSRPGGFHDPAHVRGLVMDRLTDYAYLNDPPTTAGTLFASPILKTLCDSFYEEDKWQKALSHEADCNSEWVTSVTATMVSLAATAYRSALEEWQSGHFIKKKFEAERYTKTYALIQDHILTALENDPYGDDAADRFASWASESVYVEDVLKDLPIEE